MLTLPVVLDAALKVTVVLAVAGFSTVCMQRSSAATRHAVWTLAVLAALAIPAMEILLPAWRAELLDLPGISRSQAATPSGAGETMGTNVQVPETRAFAVNPENVKSTTPAPTLEPLPLQPEKASTSLSLPQPSRTEILVGVWMFGFLATLAPLLISILRVKSFARRAWRGLSPRWKETLDALPQSALPRRKVTYLESSEASMPLACGILSPVIIVPENAERWPAWKRRNILVHELAHVQRFDCLTQAFATLLCAIYWFNPLAWVAASRMRIERELACDDRVLAAGSQPVDYADHLLEVAKSLRPAAGTGMAAIAMARPSNLSTRLVAVLDSTRSRRGMSRSGAALLAAGSLVLILPLAAFKPWKETESSDAQAPQTPSLQSKGPEDAALRAESSAEAFPERDIALDAAPVTGSIVTGSDAPSALDLKVAPTLPLARVTATLSPAGVCPGSKSTSTHIHQDNDGVEKLTLKSNTDNCSLEILAEGKFTFNDDLTDIASLAPGGSLTISETIAGRVRKLELRSVGGLIQRRYSVNGTPAAFGDEERHWLSEMLVAVERRTAFSAKTRVPRLWQNGGINAVLSEVSLMEGSYPKRVYLETLLNEGINFESAILTRIIRQIGSEFTSDYERRVVLARMPAQKFMNDESWNAFADAVAQMTSDYEKRVVLTEAFTKQRPSPEAAARLLRPATSINSSYELRVLLTGPALRYATNPVVQPAFVAAARKISSSYELRTTLAALVDEIGLAPQTAVALLEPAGRIESDYEKAEIIAAFAKRGRLTDEVVNSLVGISGSIRSDYEKHRALKAILSSNPRLDSRGLSEVLTVARSIDSDYELSSLLKEMIAKYPVRSIPREAFERALASISTEHDSNSVRAAMQRAETR
jgi:beta-lactamase regulating signal transducer with metallopeptidase domain